MSYFSRITGKWFLPSVLPIGIFVFYIAPSLATILLREDPYAKYILFYSALTMAFFILVWTMKLDLKIIDPIMALPKIKVSASALAYVIAASYFLFTAYVSVTAPSVPIIDAIQGKGIDALASGRETFLRARSGWEVVLNYGYAMFRSFLMPFAVCLMYHKRLAVRHIIVVGFLASLMLTLEKSVAIFALLPVLYFFMYRRQFKGAVMVILLTAVSMSVTAYLARGGMSNTSVIVIDEQGQVVEATQDNLIAANKSEPNKTEIPAAKKQIIINEQGELIGSSGKELNTDNLPKNVQIVVEPTKSMVTVPPKYNIFSGESQIEYLINRIIYIPYVTAHEWLRYQDEKLGGGYTYGSSISAIALLTGRPKLNLEREVFNFQWGQNDTGTGSANTAYFIDAFLNIGIFGCLLYTFVAACIIRMATLSKLRVMEACIFVPTLFLLFNSLTAMIFSGGLFLMIIFSLTMADRDEPASAGDALPSMA